MADIGRSTSAHSAGVDNVSSDYGETVDRLTNWGNWLASIPGSGSTTHPMFRGIKSGYLESKSEQVVEDSAAAEQLDRVIATHCNPLDMRLLISRFAYNLSSREAARDMRGEWAFKDRDINHKDVLNLTNTAIARVDMALQVLGVTDE